MTTKTDTQIWWDGSSTTCVKHMGFTLKSEVTAHPRRKTHITCFGKAYLMTEEEIQMIQQLVESEIVCETCLSKVGA